MNAWEKWRREPENCEVDLETRIRDMLVVAPDDSDMRRYARDLAIRYRMVREKFGEENAERDLGEMVNRFWRPKTLEERINAMLSAAPHSDDLWKFTDALARDYRIEMDKFGQAVAEASLGAKVERMLRSAREEE